MSGTSTLNIPGTPQGGIAVSDLSIFDNDLEPAVVIDLEGLDKDSVDDASMIVDGIVDLYHDEGWLKAHPRYKKRIDIELESLRGLIKMRRADEQVHDALLCGISSQNGNAQLYRALAEIQKTSLAITSKIEDVIGNLRGILEDIKEMSGESPTKEVEEDETTFRGSKDFIKDMIGDDKE